VRFLISLIEGEPAQAPPSPLIIPTQLVVRKSTGPAPR
jgi:DNA-binding LacI/PurR family transcriptional regulator